jgi:hypothetical protein
MSDPNDPNKQVYVPVGDEQLGKSVIVHLPPAENACHERTVLFVANGSYVHTPGEHYEAQWTWIKADGTPASLPWQGTPEELVSNPPSVKLQPGDRGLKFELGLFNSIANDLEMVGDFGVCDVEVTI